MVASRIRITFVVGAVLLWAVTPVVACLLPCLVTTPVKQQCSDPMGMRCEYSVMPDSQPCCQAATRPEAVLTRGQASPLLEHVPTAVPIVAHISLPDVLTASLASLAFCESPPAEAPPSSPSVLRI